LEGSLVSLGISTVIEKQDSAAGVSSMTLVGNIKFDDGNMTE